MGEFIKILNLIAILVVGFLFVSFMFTGLGKWFLLMLLMFAVGVGIILIIADRIGKNRRSKL